MTSRRVPLTNGGELIVDDDDYDSVAQFKWHRSDRIRADGSIVSYAWAHIAEFSTRNPTSIHRYLFGLRPGDRRHVDHINRDALDNRRANLRLANSSLNTANAVFPRRVGPYRGVKPVVSAGRFSAERHGRISGFKFLGSYETAEEAAVAFDLDAIQEYGEFAVTNFPRHLYERPDEAHYARLMVVATNMRRMETNHICLNGHPRVGINVRRTTNRATGVVSIRCRECDVAVQRKRAAIKKATTAPKVRVRKSHCPQGHPYRGENLAMEKDGSQKCRTCLRARQRARRKPNHSKEAA